MKRSIIIVSAIVGCFLFAINMILPPFFANNPIAQIMVAAFSGWISGIATLFIGVIATLQTEKYNQANDWFVKKQYEIEKSKSLIQSRLLFVDNLKSAWNSFRDSANPGRIITSLLSIDEPINSKKAQQITVQIALDAQFTNRATYSNLLRNIKCDYRDSEERDNSSKMLDEYRELFNSVLGEDKYTNNPQSLIDVCIGDLKDKYLSLVELMDEYVLMCDLDINDAIVNKADDFEYLSSRYSSKATKNTNA